VSVLSEVRKVSGMLAQNVYSYVQRFAAFLIVLALTIYFCRIRHYDIINEVLLYCRRKLLLLFIYFSRDIS